MVQFHWIILRAYLLTLHNYVLMLALNEKAWLLIKPAMFDINLERTRMHRSHTCKINKHAGRFSSSFLLKLLSVKSVT